jgi:hypothetical protein
MAAYCVRTQIGQRATIDTHWLREERLLYKTQSMNAQIASTGRRGPNSSDEATTDARGGERHRAQVTRLRLRCASRLELLALALVERIERRGRGCVRQRAMRGRRAALLDRGRKVLDRLLEERLELEVVAFVLRGKEEERADERLLEQREAEAARRARDVVDELVREADVRVRLELVLPVARVELALGLVGVVEQAAPVLHQSRRPGHCCPVGTHYLRSKRLGRSESAGSSWSRWFVVAIVSRPSLP